MLQRKNVYLTHLNVTQSIFYFSHRRKRDFLDYDADSFTNKCMIKNQFLSALSVVLKWIRSRVHYHSKRVGMRWVLVN